MKKVILAILLMAAATSINAQFVNLYAQCFYNGGANANCQACNYNYHRPLSCQMNIQARSSYGHFFNASQFTILMPGQCMNGYVYANNPWRDPIVNAWATTSCRFR